VQGPAECALLQLGADLLVLLLEPARAGLLLRGDEHGAGVGGDEQCEQGEDAHGFFSMEVGRARIAPSRRATKNPASAGFYDLKDKTFI